MRESPRNDRWCVFLNFRYLGSLRYVKLTYGLPRGSQRYFMKSDILYWKNNKPEIINWKVVVGPEVSYIQSYDLIFDQYDLEIRHLVGKHSEIEINKKIKGK